MPKCASFHVCLAECLGNRFLTTMMIDLSAKTTLVSALYQSQTQTQTQARDSSDDHAAITALAEGDMAKAARIMRAHIDTLAARLDESLANAGTPRDRVRAALTPAPALISPRSQPQRRRMECVSVFVR
jgi:DNA-binding GntR family transcriptional regulator